MCEEFPECADGCCLGIPRGFMSSPPLLLLLLIALAMAPTKGAKSDQLFLLHHSLLQRQQTPLGLPAARPHSPPPRQGDNPVTWSSQAIVCSTIQANPPVTLQHMPYSSPQCTKTLAQVQQACFFPQGGLQPRLPCPANFKVAPARSGCTGPMG